VKGRRVFVNKEHQLAWMAAGGAKLMNDLQPIEAKQLGGRITGQQALESGRLAEAARKGGAKSREIAEAWRAKRGRP